MKILKVVISIIACVLLASLLASAFTSAIIAQNKELDLEFSAALVVALLLFPFSFLQLGIWSGCSAWIFGGFIGGAICGENKAAILMAMLSVVLYYVIGFSAVGQAALAQMQFFDIAVILPEFFTSFGITFVGAIIGVWIGKRNKLIHLEKQPKPKKEKQRPSQEINHKILYLKKERSWEEPCQKNGTNKLATKKTGQNI
jgi:hypothetical protein